MDQSGLHERRSVKERDNVPSEKTETEVNFNEEHQHKKKTYGRTPDGTGMFVYILPEYART